MSICRIRSALPSKPYYCSSGLLGGDGFDNTKHKSHIRDICRITLSVFWRDHFQLVTICNRLISLFNQPEFQHFPVILGLIIIRLFSKHPTNINNGKEPFLFILIPCSPNLPLLKQLYLLNVRHSKSFSTNIIVLNLENKPLPQLILQCRFGGRTPTKSLS